MNVEEIKKTIAEKKTVYGTLVTSPSPVLPQFLQQLGLDVVFIDTEHIPLNSETLSGMCMIFRSMNVAPIVRIPSPDPYAASQAIDFGAAGVVAPYVETPEEVRKLRGAVKYRPLKGNRLSKYLNGGNNIGKTLKSYLDNYNDNRLLLINIESTPAMENLAEMLEVPDLDGILIGPHDLSCSLEIPEQYTHPKFTEALKLIVDTTLKKKLIAGIHFSMCGELQLATQWLKMGIRFYIHQADIVFATVSLANELRTLQNNLNEVVRFIPENIKI